MSSWKRVFSIFSFCVCVFFFFKFLVSLTTYWDLVVFCVISFVFIFSGCKFIVHKLNVPLDWFLNLLGPWNNWSILEWLAKPFTDLVPTGFLVSGPSARFYACVRRQSEETACTSTFYTPIPLFVGYGLFSCSLVPEFIV